MMPDTASCEICKTIVETIPSDGFDEIHQKCPRCGQFKLSGSARTVLQKSIEQDVRIKLSGWVHDQNRDGTVPIITTYVLEHVAARPLPSVADRAERLLLEALKGQKQLGARFNVEEPRFIAATYSQDNNEVFYLLKMLSEQDLMHSVAIGGHCEVLPKGHIAADELSRKQSGSVKGFVAMWFDDDMMQAYENGFQPGILTAGYDPVRIDGIEHINRIDDEIIAHIKSSAFVVADFTGHRGGVYFEAGFAMGLGLPVIWSCRKDQLADLHFDIRQYNCIGWETPEELATRLQRRIEATLGKGPTTVLADT